MTRTRHRRFALIITVMIGFLSMCSSVVVALAWMRSHRTGDRWAYLTDNRLYTVSSVAGRIGFYSGGWHKRAEGTRGFHWNRTTHFQFDAARSWEFLGFGYGRMWAGSDNSYAFAIPYWFLCTLTAAASVFAIMRLRKNLLVWSRWQRGMCIACGYDLRGSKERCPECGTPIRQSSLARNTTMEIQSIDAEG